MSDDGKAMGLSFKRAGRISSKSRSYFAGAAICPCAGGGAGRL